MSKQTKAFIAILAILAGVIGIGGYTIYKSELTIEQTVPLYVDSDDNIDSVRHKVETIGKPRNMAAFDLFARVMKFDNSIHTGKYDLYPGESMLQLIRKIRNHNESPIKLVVPSVRTMHDMASRLSSALMLDSAAIADYLDDEAVLADLGYTKESIPSLFIPNTYEVYWDLSLKDLMKRMKKEHDAFWKDVRTSKLKEVSEYAGREMSKTDVATMASIVDSETANNGEKPEIAALYLNRLRIGMALQSDPTVKFALQDFGLRRILNKHLEAESPYNTYKNTGLPPGPICVPSIAGLDAVLNHAHNDYIYMCAKEDFSGTHNFAVSYAEHLQNARKYTQALNARKIYK